MNLLRFVSLVCFSSSFILANQQQYPVFQAQAGSAPQAASSSQKATSSLNDMGNSVPQNVEKNEFLQFYTRQGGEITPTVFSQSGNGLIKHDISQDKLRKTVLVFVGDWCPHCHNFMTSFANSKNLEPLVKFGVNVIFINIPSIDKLRKWTDPTLDEFNSVENKISGYIKPDGVGVSLTDKISVTMLGNVQTLQKAGIEGLPVVVAVKDGKEYYRGIGESCITKLRFDDMANLMNFLDIWNDKAVKEQATTDSGPSETLSTNKKPKNKTKQPKNKKQTNKNSRIRSKKSKFTAIDLNKARAATEYLNKTNISPSRRVCRLFR